jgi:hypothetical protein
MRWVMTDRTSASEEENGVSADRREIARVIDAVGWGLFFAWVGVALLMDVGWGVGLIGVGAITLGGQAARRYYGLKLEGFWVAVGVLFALGGVWELSEVEVSLVPVLLIVAGAALLLSALRRK